MSDWGALRAKFVAVHGERKAGKAEALAHLRFANRFWAAASERRERCQNLFDAAIEEEHERGTSEGDVNAWSGVPQLTLPGLKVGRRAPPAGRHWSASTWRALERLSKAAAEEREWEGLVYEILLWLDAVDALPRKPRRVVMHGWSPVPITFDVEGKEQ